MFDGEGSRSTKSAGPPGRRWRMMKGRQSAQLAEIEDLPEAVAEAVAEEAAGSSHKVHLAPRHWQEIIALAELEADIDRSMSLIAEVEELLEVYPALLETVEDAPPPARKLAYLEPLVQRAERLLAALHAPDGDALWFDFAVQGADFLGSRNALETGLENFLCSAQLVVGDLEQSGYRQGCAEQVQQVFVSDLYRLFDLYSAVLALHGETAASLARARFVNLCVEAAQIEIDPAALNVKPATVPVVPVQRLSRSKAGEVDPG